MPSQNKQQIMKQQSEQQQTIPKQEIDTASLAAQRRRDSERRPQGHFEVDPKKTLKYSDWNQTATDVTIILFAGKKLSCNDIAVDFTSQDVRVSLTDGRRWYCRLNQMIERDASQVQLSKLKVILKMKKYTKDRQWTAMQFDPNQENAENIPKTKMCSPAAFAQASGTSETGLPAENRTLGNSPGQSKPLSNKATSTQGVATSDSSTHNKATSTQGVATSDSSTHNKATSAQGVATSGSNTHNKATSAQGVATSGSSTHNKATSAQEIVTSGSSTHNSATPAAAASAVAVRSPCKDSNEVDHEQGSVSQAAHDRVGDEPSVQGNTVAEQHASVYELHQVKHNWYELGTSCDSLAVHIYVRQVDEMSLNVTFNEKDFSVAFKTMEEKFLSLHAGTTVDTIFVWNVHVVDMLIPDMCRKKVSKASIQLTLKKKEARHWPTLDASPARGGSTSTSWMPTPTKPVQHRTTAASPSPSNGDCKDILDKVEDNLEKVRPISNDLGKVREANQGMDANWSLLENSRAAECGTDKEVSNKRPLQRNILGDSNKENLQKPTCMVSPLSQQDKLEKPQVVRPGMTGLNNLGNTCFMNSVLQVLVNTRELRDYFLDHKFQSDINEDNPLGMGGRLANTFAQLCKVLWSGKHYHYAPSKLKNLVGQRWTQFTGFAQHDAQEFMAFLLDGLHEDLNRIREKPYTESKDSDGRPDEVVADEAWAQYKKRNDSFLVDLLQGQYKSKLVCPVCSKVSITFDPFMHLSVPLPKKQRLLTVLYMSKDPSRRPVKYTLRLPRDATADDLKDAVSLKTGVHPRDLRVFEAYKHKICMFSDKGNSLANVSSADTIIVSEVLSEKVAGEPVVEIYILQRTLVPMCDVTSCTYCLREDSPDSRLKRCTQCYRAAYCNQTCQNGDWSSHRSACKKFPDFIGQPFIVSLPESQLTYSRLYQMMEQYSRYSVDVFQPPQSEGETQQCMATLPNERGDNIVSPNECQGNLHSTHSSSTVTPSCSTDSTFTQISQNSDIGDSEPVSSLPSASDSTTTSDSKGIETCREACTISPSMKIISEGVAETSFIDVPEAGAGSVGEPDSDDQLMQDTTDDAASQYHSPQANEGLSTSPEESAYLKGFHPEQEVDQPLQRERGQKTEERVTPPTRMVYGKQQGLAEGLPLFMLKPCDRDGTGPTAPEPKCLIDQGDEPLQLSSRFLAMDWCNNKKGPRYVMVQSKELQCDEDSSMRTALIEENSEITLEHCLSLFTEPEILSPEHAWYCPRCKAHREASKQLSIWRLPHTLIIQLKRFSFRNFIWRDKIDKLVEFPLWGLDLSRHFIGSLPSNEPPPIYDLYGVVNHHGGLLGGHYTSYGRCPDLSNYKWNEVDWRLFDDSIVSNTSERHIVTSAAYVLFYRRRNRNLDPSVGLSLSEASAAKGEKEEEEDVDNLNSDDMEEPQAAVSDSDDGDEDPYRDIRLSLDNRTSFMESTLEHSDHYTDMDSVD